MAKIKVALLGEGDVFVREEEIDEADFDAALHIPAEAYGGSTDVAPGKYTWNRAANCFEPIHNPADADHGLLILAALRLSALHTGEAGAIGDAARQVFALAAKRFPHLLALHARGT